MKSTEKGADRERMERRTSGGRAGVQVESRNWGDRQGRARRISSELALVPTRTRGAF